MRRVKSRTTTLEARGAYVPSRDSQGCSRVLATRVVVRKPPSGGRSPELGRAYRGYLLSPPEVGARMVIRDDDGRGLVTSPVLQVLRSTPQGALYVVTENSRYRLELAARPWSPARTAGQIGA